MRRNSFLTFLKEKSFLVVLTLMLISAGTMAVLFAVNTGDPVEKEIAKQEEMVQKAPVTENLAENKIVPQPQVQTAKKETAVVKKTETKEKEEKIQEIEETNFAELEDQYVEAEEMAEVSTEDIIAEGFGESSLLSLKWPVEGTVKMPFSMDHSVYFETLAQYQYNPAMIISVEEGTKVLAAAHGTVIDVGKHSEYGYYVTTDIGDGYELTYGQLVDITVEVGETVDAGEEFARVCFPTRSYSAEGDNLYLKLTKDGVPTDPDLYLEK